MRASDILINKIKEFEGFSPKPCKADKSEKYLTIGYGHYGADVKPRMTITKEAATILLRKDLQTAENYVNKLGVAKTQGQFDALVDFCYNLGCGALGNSTLLRKIKVKDSEKAIRAEFGRWIYCGGKILPGLVKRREWEANRYFSK